MQGAIGGGPRRRSGQSPHPHSRLRTIGRQRGCGSQETSGDGYGERDRCRMQGRRIASPFPTPVGRRWTSCGRRRRIGARNGRDGRVFNVAWQGEAFHAVSRRFATTSGFANPLPLSRQHLYALYFLIRRAF